MSTQVLSQNLEAFCEALAAEYFEVAGFVEMLEVEQRAIQDGRIEDLERLQPEKVARMGDIRHQAARRAACLRGLGYGAGASAIAKLTDEHPDLHRRVDPTWQTLVAKAWEASHLIRLNGHLIATNLQHYSARLGALMTAAAPERSVYDDAGSLHATPTGRSIGQA